MGKQDQSYENVRCLIDELIDFRKRAPQEISDVYARNNKEILKCLKYINIKLQFNEIDYQISDNFFENINSKNIYQPVDKKLCDTIYKQIQILSILIKKRNCPISKIIDDI